MAAKKNSPSKRSLRATKKAKKTSPRSLHAASDIQQQLKVATDAVSMGIWEWDIKKNTVTWSDHVYNLFGINPKTPVTFELYRSLIHPEDVHMVLDAIDGAIRKDTPYYILHRLIHPSGQIRWLEAFGKVFRNRKGTPTKMIGTAIDGTQNKLNEQERDEWKTRYELIVGSSGQLIYDYDIETGNILWSGDTIGVLGLTKEAMGDINEWVDRIHPADRDRAFADLERAQIQLEKYNVHYRFRTVDNDYREMHDRGLFLARKGKAYRMLGVMVDITEQVTTQRALEEKSHFVESITNAIPDIINVFDIHTFESIYANKSLIQQLGYTREESKYYSAHFEELLHDDSKSALARFGKRIRELRDGEYFENDIQVRVKNGEWRWYHTVYTVFKRDSDGMPLQAIGVIHDTTEEKLNHQALLESENRYRMLQQASFGGIALHDMGVILDCNQGLADMMGYTVEELVGMDGLQLITPEFRGQVLDNIKSGYEKPYDAEGLRKDGTIIAIEIRGKQVPYKGKSIRVTEFRDITERKKYTAKIMEQNQKLIAITDDLRSKNDQLEEFTQIVSHNLRSPVGNILSLLNYYEAATDEAEKQQYFSLLKESGHNTLLTLNELNEVLKVKQNPNIERQELSFEKVLQQVLSMLHVQIAEAGARIEYDFSEVPTLHYPHIYLESILLNLVSNSVKYHRQGIEPRIQLRSYKADEQTWLSVSDNGLGIDLQRNGHLLFRLRKTFHRHPESRGVGLFLIKSQINAMGGEINASSKVNEGITFTIRF